MDFVVLNVSVNKKPFFVSEVVIFNNIDYSTDLASHYM